MSLLQFDLRVMVSEPKLMAKISKLMWDTYVNRPEYLPFGQFSWPKPKAELICGVPYTGNQRPFKKFFVQVGMKPQSSMHLVEIIILTFIVRPTKIINNILMPCQLISKSPFGVFKSLKKPTKFFPGFLPQPLKRGQIKKVV